MSEGGEKTEEPTQKKIDDSRKKGQVWKSKDLSGVMIFLGGLGVVKAIWPNVEAELSKLFNYGFDKLARPDDLEHSIYVIIYMALGSMAVLCVPVVLACAIIGGLMDFLQVGSLFAIDAIKPKFEKLNPIDGLKNMFKKKQIVEGIKNLVKIFVTAYVVYGVVRDAAGMVILTARTGIEGQLTVLGELVFRVALRVGILFMVFAIFDVWWQRRSYLKDLMMSKDEVKREYKESEGDPHHKAKRKELHHEILESAQMESVRGADVVVTNPDHVAVALKYDKDSDGAPRVLAKGIDARAEAIKALAKESDVAMLRNVPLAHSLLRVDVGEEIPEDLYDAVAEVLNFVYGLKQGQAQAAG
ncbi:MAG TPA: type III secretion system export apparatus subunit SctU [Myxococcaceae bacterium]|nr:type III secretion system export apparatus subunit SctU [Myxococcaceae bacterium]